MDSAWEQEKLETRKLPEMAADRASELQANIAQPKRMSAGQPQRPAHYPGALPGRREASPKGALLGVVYNLDSCAFRHLPHLTLAYPVEGIV